MFSLTSDFTRKDFFAMVGITCLFANSITLYLTFLMAFFHGNQTLVKNNVYNEAGFEFFLLPITLLFGLFGLVHFYRTLKNVCPVCKKGKMIYRFGYGYWCPDCNHRIHTVRL